MLFNAHAHAPRERTHSARAISENTYLLFRVVIDIAAAGRHAAELQRGAAALVVRCDGRQPLRAAYRVSEYVPLALALPPLQSFSFFF